MESRVRLDGLPSHWFPVKQSVRQGGVLSPMFHNTYINGLLLELRHSGLGAYIGPVYCGVVAQADDIALIALTPLDLQ